MMFVSVGHEEPDILSLGLLPGSCSRIVFDLLFVGAPQHELGTTPPHARVINSLPVPALEVA